MTSERQHKSNYQRRAVKPTPPNDAAAAVTVHPRLDSSSAPQLRHSRSPLMDFMLKLATARRLTRSGFICCCCFPREPITCEQLLFWSAVSNTAPVRRRGGAFLRKLFVNRLHPSSKKTKRKKLELQLFGPWAAAAADQRRTDAHFRCSTCGSQRLDDLRRRAAALSSYS